MQDVKKDFGKLMNILMNFIKINSVSNDKSHFQLISQTRREQQKITASNTPFTWQKHIGFVSYAFPNTFQVYS